MVERTCDCCESILIITDEGFMACKNPSCGVIYKDMLDQGAEWRFMGQMIIVILIQRDVDYQLIHYLKNLHMVVK